jgi:hypothetical protein
MSNYLAEGLQGGFQLGYSAAAQKKRDKKQAEDQKARDVLQGEQQKSLQTERLVADAKRDFDSRDFQGKQAEADRSFRSGEAATDRGYRSSEAATDRGFRSGESQKDRDARLASETKTIEAQRVLQNESLLAQAARQQEQLTQGQGQFDATIGLSRDKFSWDQNPENPENVSRAAYAKALEAKSMGFGDIAPAGAGGQVPPPAAARPLTAEDQAALQWAKSNPQDPRAAAIIKKITTP